MFFLGGGGGELLAKLALSHFSPLSPSPECDLGGHTSRGVLAAAVAVGLGGHDAAAAAAVAVAAAGDWSELNRIRRFSQDPPPFS